MAAALSGGADRVTSWTGSPVRAAWSWSRSTTARPGSRCGSQPADAVAGEKAREVSMATHVAEQLTARARRPAVSAGVPVLASKITAPGLPDWTLLRPRITKLIAQGRRWCPLTVVTGPAGAGKTIALALWAAAGPGSVAWVCLDEFDNRPGVFWAYLVAALRRSGVSVPGALPAAARGRAAGHVFLLRLAAALAAQDPPVTVVLDDLHLLTDPRVLDGLGYVLTNAGPACGWWFPRGWTRRCRCTATGWPGSWPRSGPATWRSPSLKPGSSWPGMASR